ncbi:DUF4249 domain-containing protein [Chryseotalea sanaruensis]|uniref:DUF4249 domain-containing protein n=1 Tax=Chryseotalea sanaruensis TaxID=2482724 RepID=A0A401U861_9BACT|nr:DUF4249 domain-containing protein [Chryseotalea sanaruensis]GCC51091.1 DUF4249 domain-containing protein [Chryseotalea sanaruensis]
MKISIKNIFLLPIVFCYLQCDTGPTIDYTLYEPKLVVDGWIEAGNFPKVILSKSYSYFDDIDSATVRQLVETKAKITVSDGVESEVLTLKKDENYFPPYIYSGTDLKGEAGKTYTLKIELRGEVYTSSTTIPPAASFEDLWYEVLPGKDTLGFIYGKFTDNPDTDNYYRIFTQRIGKDSRYIPVYLSAIGDQSFNGKTFTFSLLRGPDNFTDVADDLYFTVGDSVRIKFCTMDKAHFDFWRTLERELYVVGNPFSSAGNEIISNIKGKKAIGVWGGYGVKFYTIKAKER